MCLCVWNSRTIIEIDSLYTKFIRIKDWTIGRIIIFFRSIRIAFTFYSFRWNLVIRISLCSTFFDLIYKIKFIIYKAILRKNQIIWKKIIFGVDMIVTYLFIAVKKQICPKVFDMLLIMKLYFSNSSLFFLFGAKNYIFSDSCLFIQCNVR